MASSLRFSTINRITDVAATGLANGFVLNGPAVVYGDGLNCTIGVDQINLTTPGFAYFDVMRVRRWSLLSGTVAARFPASTRVLTVAGTQLIMSNVASSSTPSDEAGTFTPAIAADESAPYLIDNLTKHDRRVLWKESGAPTFADFDLGANRLVTLAGMHGHRPIGLGAVGITSIVLKYATAATGYPPASGGAWTNANGGVFGASGGLRDQAVLLTGGGNTGRYWRFDIDGTASAFTLGKFHLGVLNTDLGILYSAADIEQIVPRIEERTTGMDPVVTVVGDIRREFELHYTNITETMLNTLLALAARNLSFIMLDHNDIPYEVIVKGGRMQFSHRFGPTHLFDATLSLEQLG